MAGQVDVIVSKKAIDEIKRATEELNKLHAKILQVNKSGAKSKVGGIGNNQALVSELQSINKLITANNKLAAANGKRLASLNSATKATKRSTSANKKSLSVLKSLSAAMRGFVGLFVIQKIAEFGKAIFELAKTFDSLRFAIEKTSRTIEIGQMNMRFMLETSRDLGLNLVATTTRFIKFSAAARNSGLVMKDTQKIFLTMAKAGAVLGLRTDELSGVFLALEQMLSKGKVTTEELRRQLGERLPGAFGIMAASLGVTLPKLDEMLKKGELISSEVLPGFADAVEVAFGLDTVDKIDTIVAAENRLSTAWQSFVKNLTGSDSVISNFFKGILGYITEAVDASNMLWNKEEAMEQLQIRNSFNQTKNEIEDYARFRVNLARKTGNKIEDINKEMEEAKKLRDKATKKEDIAKANEEIRLANVKQLKFQKEVNEFATADAQNSFEKALKNKMLAEEELNKVKKQLADIKESNDKLSLSEKMTSYIPTGDIENKIEKLVEKFNRAQGKLNATRLLAEESADPIKKDDDDGGGKRQRNLKNIKDLERQIKIEILEDEIRLNKVSIENVEENMEERIILAEENKDKLIEISRLKEEQINEDNKKARDRDIANIKKGIEEGTIEKEKGNKQIELLNKEYDQKEILAELGKNKEIALINNQYQKFVENEKDLSVKRQLADIEAFYNVQKAQLKEDYENSKKTAKDKEKLEKGLAKIAVDSANARIDVLIAEQMALLNVKGATEEYYNAIKNVIAKLNADRPNNDGGTTDLKEQLQSDLDYLSQFADAAGDIANAVFDGKIARIDEEIRREQDKYALLLLLAEGDAEKQKYLRIQEEEDLQKLEKKKRKIQRDQAKFNKAQALIDIAINTAVAISKTTSTLGPFGLPLIPVIKTLGLLQAAAVLAQPLPAFAEGGIMDHDGLALVGDGGKKEVIKTPDGKLAVTPDTNTIMHIPKGSEIFPSIEKFNNENPNESIGMVHSASLLASISLNQKNIEGVLFSQRELDERLLDAMLMNTKAVKNSKSNIRVNTQRVDLSHDIWKSKLLN